MSDIVDVVGNTVTRAKLDGETLRVQQIFHNDKALAQNRRIASSGMLDRAKLGLHDDEDVRMVISCPCGDQWSLFKRKYPEIHKRLLSRDEPERMKGARELSLLHPGWVVYSRM